MSQLLDQKQTTDQQHELLNKYGHAWAVLTAWCMDLEEKTKIVPQEALQVLEKIRVEIKSGCYSACDVGCLMTTVLGKLTPMSSSMGDDFFDNWMNLYLQAMDGTLDHKNLVSIPALKPVLSSCGFLKCSCGQ